MVILLEQTRVQLGGCHLKLFRKCGKVHFRIHNLSEDFPGKIASIQPQEFCYEHHPLLVPSSFTLCVNPNRLVVHEGL